MSETPQNTQEVLSLVQACAPFINTNHAQELTRAFRPPAPNAGAPEPTAGQLEAVYRTALQLCDEGNYQFAAALALHLFTYRPGEPRFGLIAGTCMQGVGAHASAAKFFCYALVAGGDHPGALLRLGECLLALGDRDNAEKAFDAALDVSRDMPGAEEILGHSHELLASLRQRT